MAPLVRLYEQIPKPKYVVSMGACTITEKNSKTGTNYISSSNKSVVQQAELWWKEHPSTHYWESN